MREQIRRLVRRAGFELVPLRPVDIGADVWRIIERVRPYTMTSVERINAVCEAVRYVTAAGVPGAFVECGVWRGGSTMAALLALLDSGNTDREIFLYDTFEGMAPPTSRDRAVSGESAAELLANSERDADSVWCYASLRDVRANVLGTGYPKDRLHFIAGKVEETIPQTIPDSIALLRLDTDWYESTKHELEHLYPRLNAGGVLIVDDYGHWQGAREAVDEYFAQRGEHILLNRIDYTGRIAVKG
ncbi:MAG TPA: TylF/MycF/NovP-related O-methyltransferase [Candidatus Baltobacteraceae bacterium]|jgi:hypothetical protein|nr:TylF/MycF/NovP-related O-methyltransferase [Candidatus Baltobacteraceae bacterium]